jgi:hypothetical protein
LPFTGEVTGALAADATGCDRTEGECERGSDSIFTGVVERPMVAILGAGAGEAASDGWLEVCDCATSVLTVSPIAALDRGCSCGAEGEDGGGCAVCTCDAVRDSFASTTPGGDAREFNSTLLACSSGPSTCMGDEAGTATCCVSSC